MGQARIELQEPAARRMPTTAEIMQQAAAAFSPVLGPDYFGKVLLVYEHGKCVRVVKEESFMLNK